LLREHQRGKQQRQYNAVHERAGENRSFLTLQLGHSGTSGDILRRYHLTYDTTGRVRRGKEYRVEVELLCGDHLQISEQRIAGRVATRQCHCDPAEERRV